MRSCRASPSPKISNQNFWYTKKLANPFVNWLLSRSLVLLTMQCDYPDPVHRKDQEQDHMQDKLRDLSCGISLQLSELLKNIYIDDVSML